MFDKQGIKRPYLVMMVGLPGSGKSTYASNLMVGFDGERKPIIHSSDALRAELFGSEETQGDNKILFDELHRRIKEDLLAGHDVIYDATNINKKRRTAFLDELKRIPCITSCVCVMTTLDACLRNNSQRERKVPDDVIVGMFKNWNPPDYTEGFNIVKYVFSYGDSDKEKYTIEAFYEIADSFDQENSHHQLTLGAHGRRASDYINAHGNDPILYIAALLHDVGKLYTKTRLNHKGEFDGNYHYYQHNCVGAYESLFYLENLNVPDSCKTYISNLIYYHMHPYLQWKQSNRAKHRDKLLLGEKMFDDIMLLHEADVFAH